MNNYNICTLKSIMNKLVLVFIIVFLFISHFEVTKILALTSTQEKNQVYGKYYDSDYSYNTKINTQSETIQSNGMGNHIHFNLDDELNNGSDDNVQIDDSSFVYEYSIDEYTTVYESSDNNDYKLIEISNEIVNYEVNDDTYLPIDTTIIESSLDEYEYENTSNTIESYYPNLLENGLLFTVKDTSISYKPLLIQNSNPIIYNNQLIYPIENDINLHYTIKNSYIKENIVLNAPIDNNIFEYEIAINNGSYYLSDNKLYIKDDNNQDILYIEAPIAYDCNNIQTYIDISIENNFLTYSIDNQWLKDESRAYPITIDPSFIYITVNDGSDISILESKPDETIGLNNNPIDKYLYLGLDNEYGQSYSLYTYASYKKAPRNIIVDSFILTYDIDSTDSDNTINYSIINDDINFTSITYNDLDTISQKITDTKSLSYSVTDNQVSLDLTSYAKQLLEEDKKDSFIFMSLSDEDHYLRLDSTSSKLEFKFHYPTDDNDDYDNLRYYLRPFVKRKVNEGITEFVSLGVDGSDSLNRNISVSLYKEDELLDTNTTTVDNYLYNYPDYPVIEDCPDKYIKPESNWQLDSLFSNLEADKLYTIKINDGYMEKKEIFRLYTVKDFVLIQNIASFYGVSIEDLLEDNNLSDSLIYEDNILFIRNPSLNKDKDYVPEDLSDINNAINASLRGNSNDENSNIIMGNFILENTDFTLLESDLQFDLIRTYNSSSHNQLGLMGYGFDFSYNSYVLKGKKGAILLLPSGKKLFFSKENDIYTNSLSSDYDLTYKDDHFELLFKVDNTRYIFDKLGSLSKIIYHTGKTITLTYKNRLLSKVDLGNNTYLSLTYNKKSLLSKVVASDNTSVSYEYDDQGNLISFKDQLGNTSTYEYDENHLLISYKDFNNKTVYENKYNDNHKLSKQIDSLGNSHTLEYTDNTVIFTDSRNNQTIYHYDENFYTSKIEYPDDSFELYRYELGILTSYTNKYGLGYQYTYDSNNNLIKEVRSDGFITDNTYDESNNLLQSSNSYGQKLVYTYDQNNNNLTKTDSLGNTYTYTYNDNSKLTSETDPKGNKTTYEYDSNNNLTKVIYPDNTYHKMSYNASGFLISLTNEKGHKETHTLDDKNQLLIVTYHDGSKEKYEYDNNGNIIKYENRNKAVSLYEYNTNNKLIKSTDPKGNSTTYEYDSALNLIKTIFPDGSYVENEYDCLDRLIRKDTSGYIEEYTYNHYGISSFKDPLNYTTYEYDYLGNIIKETTNDLNTINRYDSLSRLIETTNPKGITDTYEYDLNNQIIKQISPLKSITFEYDSTGNISKEVITTNDSIKTNTYEYDSRNNLIKKTDSLNNEYAYQYDGLLLTSQIDPLGNTISYSFDSNSRITSIKDPNNNTSYKKYDYEGNIIEEKDNKGYITKYTYDLNDNLISKTNPDGGIYTYEYDSNNRLIKKTSPLSKVTSYTYDSYGDILETRINDRLVSSYIYDETTKLLLSETSNGLTNSYEYDQKGNLIKHINPYCQIFYYEYDIYNRLIKEYTDEGLLSSYTYNDYDLLLDETDKYGKSTTYSYNDDLNLISKSDHNKSYSYQYDLLDNLIEETDYLDNTKTYEYDGDNRLIKSVINDRVSTYEYDSNSNLISFLDPENQLTTYSYDSNNNLIKKINNDGHIYEYEYNRLNRLIKETTDDQLLSKKRYDLESKIFESYDGQENKTTYIYDNFGNNVAIIDPKGFRTTYEYDKHFNLIRITDPKGNTTTNIYNDLNQLIEVKDSRNNSIYYEYDLYNNVSKYINPLGGISSYTYNHKGQLLQETSSSELVKSYSYNINNDIEKIYLDDTLNNTYIYDDYFRLIEQIDALGYKKIYEYDSYNNLISLKDEEDYSRSYEYDKLDRLIKEIDSTNLITTYSYDCNDNIINKQLSDSIYFYLYDSRNSLISYTDPNNNTYRYEYDKANRLIKEIDSLNNYRIYKYDENSNLIEQTDYKQNITKHIYDENNNLIQDIDPLGNIKTYTYDSNNNLSSSQNESGYITVYEYDKANNLISIKNNILSDNSHLIEYEYDSSNRLIKATSYEGIIEEYSYDTKDNVLIYKQGSVTVDYSYDLNNNLIRKDNIRYYYDRLNRLIKVSDNTGISLYSYNAESDLLSLRQSNEKIYYSYNDKHQIKSIIYGKDRKIEYSYDLNGNIKEVKDNDSLTKYSYDKLNRQIRSETIILNEDNNTANNSYGFNKIYADDEDIITTFKTFDLNSNIKSIKSYLNNDLILEERYDYDSLNKLTDKYSNRNGTISSTSYRYNEAGQLIESDHDGTKNIYTRLLDGKTITSEANNTIIYEYNDDGQLIRSTTNNETTTYRYDDRGNRISETSDNKKTSYTYDKYNNLLKISNPDGYFFEYEYDGLNNRISLKVPYRVYELPKTGLNDITINESSGIDNSSILNNTSYNSYDNYRIRYRKLYYLNDYTTNTDTYIGIKLDNNNYRYTTIGSNDTTISTNNRFLLSDYQESIVLSLSKDNLYTINTYGYSDYGVSNIDNNPLDSKSISISYTNQDISLNKLIYLHSRYYDPKTQSFISKDTYKGNIYDNTTLNGYNYCIGDPINHIDPTGHRSVPVMLSDGGGGSSNNSTNNSNTAYKPPVNTGSNSSYTPPNSGVNDYYSSYQGSNNTYRQPKKVSLRFTSSSATAENNTSLWNRIVNKVNNLKSNVLSYKDNLKKQIQSIQSIYNSQPGLNTLASIAGYDTSIGQYVSSASISRNILTGNIISKHSNNSNNGSTNNTLLGPYTDNSFYTKDHVGEVGVKESKFIKWVDSNLSNIATTGLVIGGGSFFAAVTAVTMGVPLVIGGSVLSASLVATGLTLFGIASAATSFIAGYTNISTGLSKESLDGRTLSDEESQERIQNGGSQMLQSLTVMAEGAILNKLINKNDTNTSQNTNENSSENAFHTGEQVKLENRGSTGRTTPRNINEQIALEQSKYKPLEQADPKALFIIENDSRWKGWEKRQIVYRFKSGNNITIHFNYDPINNLYDDFKIVHPE